MKKLALALTGLLVAGALLAPAVQAQTAASSGPAARQRAPGVPLSPRPDDIARLKADERGQHADRREARNARIPEPDRDLPMPRGVPSIIAPSR